MRETTDCPLEKKDWTLVREVEMMAGAVEQRVLAHARDVIGRSGCAVECMMRMQSLSNTALLSSGFD